MCSADSLTATIYSICQPVISTIYTEKRCTKKLRKTRTIDLTMQSTSSFLTIHKITCNLFQYAITIRRNRPLQPKISFLPLALKTSNQQDEVLKVQPKLGRRLNHKLTSSFLKIYQCAIKIKKNTLMANSCPWPLKQAM